MNRKYLCVSPNLTMLQHILLVLAAVVVASTQAAAPITEAGMKTEATLLTNWGKFFNLYV